MRILVIAPMPPDPDAPGAIPRVLWAQVHGLRERHEVAVVCVAGPETHQLAALDALPARGVTVRAVARTDPTAARDRWARRRVLAGGWLRGGRPWRTVWFHDPRLQDVVDRAVAEFRPDVAVVEDNALGMVRLPAGLPAVITEHEVRRPRPRRLPRPGTGLARGLLAEADWRRWEGYQRRVWERYALIQVFTERDAAAVASIAPHLADRVRVTPFGLELQDPLDPAAEVPDEVVFVGNYTHAPNVDAATWLAAEIMPRLRRERPAARLTLVGDQPPASVRALACPTVRVTGRVDDLRGVLGHAALVVAPLRIGGGMRVKVLEAMALGKAVVTTPRGAEGIRVDPDAPPLGVAGDAASLATAAARLLASPAERAEMGRRARRYVLDHHGPGAYAARAAAVYEQALAVRR